jgi:hypothetical protein
MGQPLSRESFLVPGADGVLVSEGDAGRRDCDRTVRPGVVFRPWHVLKLLRAETGRSLVHPGANAAGSRQGEES